MSTTQLEAVNRLLRMVQLDPVEGLDGLISADAQALDALNYAHKEICMQQWSFNTEETTLKPDASGEIKVGFDVLGVALACPSDNSRWVVRDGKLYDTKEGMGFKVEREIQATLTRLIPWDQMQEHQKQLVVATAARTWVRDKTADPVLIRSLNVEWQLARERFLQVESGNTPVNLLDTNKPKRWQDQLAGHWANSTGYFGSRFGGLP